MHEAQGPKVLTMLVTGVLDPVLGVVYPLPRWEGVCTPEVPRSCR